MFSAYLELHRLTDAATRLAVITGGLIRLPKHPEAVCAPSSIRHTVPPTVTRTVILGQITIVLKLRLSISTILVGRLGFETCLIPV